MGRRDGAGWLACVVFAAADSNQKTCCIRSGSQIVKRSHRHTVKHWAGTGHCVCMCACVGVCVGVYVRASSK